MVPFPIAVPIMALYYGNYYGSLLRYLLWFPIMVSYYGTYYGSLLR